MPVEDTWTAVLTRRGLPTYNLGVQGYAPQQVTGALRRYGRAFAARYVVFGYTPGFEERALHFERAREGGRAPTFVGGIGDSHNYLDERRARQSRPWFPVLNALLDGATEGLQRRWERRPRRVSSFDVSRREVERQAAFVFGSERREWQLTLAEILQAKTVAGEMNARLLVLLFAQRGLTYYERVMGAEPPAGHFELQVAANLRAFARTHDIDVVETYPAFRAYVRSLGASPDPATLPYFSVDGHLNRVGHGLVADAVAAHLDRLATR